MLSYKLLIGIMYDLILHKHLHREKWMSYTFDRQILMIANEVNRYMNGVKSGLDEASQRECLERIFELCDLTISCQDGGRRRELARFREIIGSYYAEQSEFTSEIQSLAKVLLLSTRTTEALL